MPTSSQSLPMRQCSRQLVTMMRRTCTRGAGPSEATSAGVSSLRCSSCRSRSQWPCGTSPGEHPFTHPIGHPGRF